MVGLPVAVIPDDVSHLALGVAGMGAIDILKQSLRAM